MTSVIMHLTSKQYKNEGENMSRYSRDLQVGPVLPGGQMQRYPRATDVSDSHVAA